MHSVHSMGAPQSDLGALAHGRARAAHRLYFVCSEPRPTDPDGCAGVVVRLTSPASQGCYLAFRDARMAAAFLRKARLTGRCFAISAGDLGPEHCFDFERHATLIVEDETDIDALLAKGGALPPGRTPVALKLAASSAFFEI